MFRFFAALTFTFTVLCVLWCTAASAATYEESCYRRPMTQGMVGEQVTTCELHRVTSTVTVAPSRARQASHHAPRTGRTTVMHYGHRAPTYSITYLASR